MHRLIFLRLPPRPSSRLLHSTLRAMSESSAQATPSETPSGTSTPADGGAVPLTKSAGSSSLTHILGHSVLRQVSRTEKKLAKKKENEARLALKAAKAAKAAAAAPAGESKKAKKEKEVKEEEPEFVNTTPKGEKKGTPSSFLAVYA